MAHSHERLTADEQALVDAAKAELADLFGKVIKASITPEVLARLGFKFTGYDGKTARRWKLELENGTRTLTCEGTLFYGVSTYIGTTKAKETKDG